MNFALPASRPTRLALALATLLGLGALPAQAQAVFNASTAQSLPVSAGGLPLFTTGLVSVLGSVDCVNNAGNLSGTTVIGGDLRLRGGTRLSVTASGNLYIYGNLLVEDGSLTIQPGGHVYLYGDQLSLSQAVASSTTPTLSGLDGGGTLHLVSPRPAANATADGQQRAGSVDGLPGGQAVQYVDGGSRTLAVNVEHRAAGGLVLADLNGDGYGQLGLSGKLTLAAQDAPITLGPNNLLIDKLSGSSARIVGYSPARFIQTNAAGQLRVAGLAADSSFVFPVGYGASADYTPARVTNRQGAAQSYGMAVSPTAPAAAGQPTAGRYWQFVAADANALFDLTLEHNVATNEPGYSDASAAVSRYNGAWAALSGPRAGTAPGTLSTSGPVAGASELSQAGVTTPASAGTVVTFTKQSVQPLPVVLTLFTAQHRAGTPTVELAWQTASEKNTAGFEVERSATGTAFAKIGYVAGAGTSTTTRNYRLTTPFVGEAYYRLRQVDLDGTFTYSPVRHIGPDGTSEPFAAYPSPTAGAFRVSGAEPSRPVEILNMLGQVVAVLPAGINSSDAIPQLASGAYIVRQDRRQARLLVR